MNVVLPANYQIAKPFNQNPLHTKIKKEEAWRRLSLSEKLVKDAIRLMAHQKEYRELAEEHLINANQALVRATNAFSEAQVNLSQAELKSLQSERHLDVDGDNEPRDDTDRKARAELSKAIAALRDTRNELQTARDLVHIKSTELEALGDAQLEGEGKMEAILADYVKEAYHYEKAKRLHHLAKDGQQKRNAAAKLTFYAELGEDATDNYGEPLQFNNRDIWHYGVEYIKKQPKQDREDVVQDLLKMLRKNVLQAFTDKPERSYQAVVLTAVKSTRPEMKNHYQQQHSQYSESHAIYGIAD